MSNAFASNPHLEDKRQLMNAAEAGDVAILRAVLARGTPADTIVDSFSSLYIAAGRNDVPTMEALLDFGANPNLMLSGRAKQGTALNKAAGAASCEAVSWLLNHGANPRITDPRRRTAGHVLLGNLQKINRQPGGEDFSTAALAQMLDLGLPLDQVDGDKRTLLHTAVMAGPQGVPAVELLMSRGANPYVVDKDGAMPIHLAARGGRVEALRTLVDRGVNINTADERGRCALHLYQTVATGEAILALSPDIECQDIDGRTPLAERLSRAMPERLTPEVCQLLEYGASLDTPAFDGTTPRSIITKRKMSAVAAALAARAARIAMMRARLPTEETE
jgi:ankyrin repeat protein